MKDDIFIREPPRTIMDNRFVVFSIIIVLLASVLIVRYRFTGEITAQVGVNVTCMVAMSLPVNSINFGSLAPGASSDTTNNSPYPIVVQNDGGAMIDVTIARESGSSPLFGGTGGGDNSDSFQFKARDPNATSFNASASITTFTPIPGTTPITFVKQLSFGNGHNHALADLLINVPSDEPPGEKSELLDFIATDSGFGCGNATLPQAACINFDLSKAEVKGDDKKLVYGEFENTCSFPVTITRAKLTWTSSAYIKELKIDGGTQWKNDCSWSCSPTGLQPSGTLLDFGTADKTIKGDATKKIKEAIFNASVAGSTFEIELVMQDGSSAFSGPFTPS